MPDKRPVLQRDEAESTTQSTNRNSIFRAFPPVPEKIPHQAITYRVALPIPSVLMIPGPVIRASSLPAAWREIANSRTRSPHTRLHPSTSCDIRKGNGERIVFVKINRVGENMSSSSSSVEEKIRSLPPELRDEAIHFIDELVRRSKKGSPSSFRCVAEGSLAYLGTRYSSVDLQHKANEWRD